MSERLSSPPVLSGTANPLVVNAGVTKIRRKAARHHLGGPAPHKPSLSPTVQLGHYAQCRLLAMYTETRMMRVQAHG
jgi:hypothetical protein